MLQVFSCWTTTSSMAVQVGLGTQTTDSSLIGEEVSALTHSTIQRAFSLAALVCLLMDLQDIDSLQVIGIMKPMSCSAYSSWKYFSSALRTFDRARWRRTR